jgi:hypothetical protein
MAGVSGNSPHSMSQYEEVHQAKGDQGVKSKSPAKINPNDPNSQAARANKINGDVRSQVVDNPKTKKMGFISRLFKKSTSPKADKSENKPQLSPEEKAVSYLSKHKFDKIVITDNLQGAFKTEFKTRRTYEVFFTLSSNTHILKETKVDSEGKVTKIRYYQKDTKFEASGAYAIVHKWTELKEFTTINNDDSASLLTKTTHQAAKNLATRTNMQPLPQDQLLELIVQDQDIPHVLQTDGLGQRVKNPNTEDVARGAFVIQPGDTAETMHASTVHKFADQGDLLGKVSSMDFKESFKAMQQLSKSLAHAHSKNIVLKDIKPENILVRSAKSNDKDNIYLYTDTGGGLNLKKNSRDLDFTWTSFYHLVRDFANISNAIRNNEPAKAQALHKKTDIYAQGLTFLYTMIKHYDFVEQDSKYLTTERGVIKNPTEEQIKKIGDKGLLVDGFKVNMTKLDEAIQENANLIQDKDERQKFIETAGMAKKMVSLNASERPSANEVKIFFNGA